MARGRSSFYNQVMSDCVFCRLARGEIERTTPVRYEDDEILAFDDRSPAAPTHLLVIPKKHIGSWTDLREEDQALLGRICYRIKLLADELGLASQGFRVTVNAGKWGGQIVPHLHFHLLGGAPLAGHLVESSHGPR